ncbi:MAG TPA: histidine kinase [Haliscomenobacter sp.]|uniref:sensor histidine kinase n=1 Tax=Haliscomenobacter sp. TaxID=2717303 RepID=UPI002D012F02|nr:histidine kinase [Haliscomenobacter sp.]HOY19107.1 histidine kinase [Haliscomenobacter sp.]HPH19544.1 histidine kinase [Haliscomenobacter sp.]
MQNIIQRRRVLLIHLSFWCIYFFMFSYQISNRKGVPEPWSDIIPNAILQVVYLMSVAYANYLFYLPRFLKHKQWWRFALELLVTIFITTWIFLIIKRYLVDGYTYQAHFAYSTSFAITVAMSALFIASFIAMLKFLEDWFQLEASRQEMINEKLSAELQFLKAQINPHFLFNTLNNLYYLAYTQSPNTTEVIAKLSQMMRYMIYDSNYQRVPLNKELEYMQNYISLENLRLNEQIPIKFEVEGNPEQVLITPLILITFLENAFKHGVGNNNPQAWVNISIKVNQKTCIYTVENSKLPTKAEGEKSGIGLQNVRRRLELSYPNQYELVEEERSDSYFVQLKLDLQ